MDPRGMTPYEYASISYPMNMSQYHVDKIFRKYLDIPETDPRTGKRITIEKSDAKKFKFGPKYMVNW